MLRAYNYIEMHARAASKAVNLSCRKLCLRQASLGYPTRAISYVRIYMSIMILQDNYYCILQCKERRIVQY